MAVMLNDDRAEAQRKLWEAVKSFIEKYQIYCPETLVQVDRVNEALPELAEQCCEIVRYKQFEE